MRTPLLAVVGPTASGKTALAVHLAEALAAEVVSVDSMLVYRGMDIGTAKPDAAERARVPHHLIDVADPSESFSVARYQEMGRRVLDTLSQRGRPALLAGGSGLYFRALVDDLDLPGSDPGTRALLEREAAAAGASHLYDRLVRMDPVAAAKIEPGNVRRTVRALEVAAITGTPFSDFAGAWDRFPSDGVRVAGLDVSRPLLAERIGARVERMLADGWLDEVRALMDRGFGRWLTASQAIGYAELVRHLEGRSTLEDAVELTIKRTKALARRQMAWFRRDPRIRWFSVPGTGPDVIVDDLRTYLEAEA
jgi:tRNA dimethylallyltransferase